MYYPINDHELDSMASRNTEQSVFTSLASFLVAIAISIVITLVVEDEDRAITLLLSGAAAVLVLVAVVLFGLALYIRRANRTEVQRIKDQSRSI